MANAPPRPDAAKPSGKAGPSTRPLCRKSASNGPVPKTCSQNNRIERMKKRAWATGSLAIMRSISLAQGTSGSSSRRSTKYFSSPPAPCICTTRGLRVSATLGVRKPPAAPNMSAYPFCSCRSFARAPSEPQTSAVKTMSSESAAFTSGSTSADLITSLMDAPSPKLTIAASIFSADAPHTLSSRS